MASQNHEAAVTPSRTPQSSASTQLLELRMPSSLALPSSAAIPSQASSAECQALMVPAEEVLRLMLDTLHGMGLKDSARTLAAESGIGSHVDSEESDSVTDSESASEFFLLRDAILKGDWPAVLSRLQRLLLAGDCGPEAARKPSEPSPLETVTPAVASRIATPSHDQLAPEALSRHTTATGSSITSQGSHRVHASLCLLALRQAYEEAIVQGQLSHALSLLQHGLVPLAAACREALRAEFLVRLQDHDAQAAGDHHDAQEFSTGSTVASSSGPGAADVEAKASTSRGFHTVTRVPPSPAQPPEAPAPRAASSQAEAAVLEAPTGSRTSRTSWAAPSLPKPPAAPDRGAASTSVSPLTWPVPVFPPLLGSEQPPSPRQPRPRPQARIQADSEDTTVTTRTMAAAAAEAQLWLTQVSETALLGLSCRSNRCDSINSLPVRGADRSAVSTSTWSLNRLGLEGEHPSCQVCFSESGCGGTNTGSHINVSRSSSQQGVASSITLAAAPKPADHAVAALESAAGPLWRAVEAAAPSRAAAMMTDTAGFGLRVDANALRQTDSESKPGTLLSTASHEVASGRQPQPQPSDSESESDSEAGPQLPPRLAKVRRLTQPESDTGGVGHGDGAAATGAQFKLLNSSDRLGNHHDGLRLQPAITSMGRVTVATPLGVVVLCPMLDVDIMMPRSGLQPGSTRWAAVSLTADELTFCGLPVPGQSSLSQQPVLASALLPALCGFTDELWLLLENRFPGTGNHEHRRHYDGRDVPLRWLYDLTTRLLVAASGVRPRAGMQMSTDRNARLGHHDALAVSGSEDGSTHSGNRRDLPVDWNLIRARTPNPNRLADGAVPEHGRRHPAQPAVKTALQAGGEKRDDSSDESPRCRQAAVTDIPLGAARTTGTPSLRMSAHLQAGRRAFLRLVERWLTPSSKAAPPSCMRLAVLLGQAVAFQHGLSMATAPLPADPTPSSAATRNGGIVTAGGASLLASASDSWPSSARPRPARAAQRNASSLTASSERTGRQELVVRTSSRESDSDSDMARVAGVEGAAGPLSLAASKPFVFGPSVEANSPSAVVPRQPERAHHHSLASSAAAAAASAASSVPAISLSGVTVSLFHDRHTYPLPAAAAAEASTSPSASPSAFDSASTRRGQTHRGNRAVLSSGPSRLGRHGGAGAESGDSEPAWHWSEGHWDACPASALPKPRVLAELQATALAGTPDHDAATQAELLAPLGGTTSNASASAADDSDSESQRRVGLQVDLKSPRQVWKLVPWRPAGASAIETHLGLPDRQFHAAASDSQSRTSSDDARAGSALASNCQFQAEAEADWDLGAHRDLKFASATAAILSDGTLTLLLDITRTRRGATRVQQPLAAAASGTGCVHDRHPPTQARSRGQSQDGHMSERHGPGTSPGPLTLQFTIDCSAAVRARCASSIAITSGNGHGDQSGAAATVTASGQGHRVTEAAWSHNGRWLLTGSSSSSVAVLWDVHVLAKAAQAQAQAQAQYGRNRRQSRMTGRHGGRASAQAIDVDIDSDLESDSGESDTSADTTGNSKAELTSVGQAALLPSHCRSAAQAAEATSARLAPLRLSTSAAAGAIARLLLPGPQYRTAPVTGAAILPVRPASRSSGAAVSSQAEAKAETKAKAKAKAEAKAGAGSVLTEPRHTPSRSPTRSPAAGRERCTSASSSLSVSLSLNTASAAAAHPSTCSRGASGTSRQLPVMAQASDSDAQSDSDSESDSESQLDIFIALGAALALQSDGPAPASSSTASSSAHRDAVQPAPAGGCLFRWRMHQPKAVPVSSGTFVAAQHERSPTALISGQSHGVITVGHEATSEPASGSRWPSFTTPEPKPEPEPERPSSTRRSAQALAHLQSEPEGRGRASSVEAANDSRAGMRTTAAPLTSPSLSLSAEAPDAVWETEPVVALAAAQAASGCGMHTSEVQLPSALHSRHCPAKSVSTSNSSGTAASACAPTGQPLAAPLALISRVVLLCAGSKLVHVDTCAYSGCVASRTRSADISACGRRACSVSLLPGAPDFALISCLGDRPPPLRAPGQQPHRLAAAAHIGVPPTAPPAAVLAAQTRNLAGYTAPAELLRCYQTRSLRRHDGLTQSRDGPGLDSRTSGPTDSNTAGTGSQRSGIGTAHPPVRLGPGLSALLNWRPVSVTAPTGDEYQHHDDCAYRHSSDTVTFRTQHHHDDTLAAATERVVAGSEASRMLDKARAQLLMSMCRANRQRSPATGIRLALGVNVAAASDSDDDEAADDATARLRLGVGGSDRDDADSDCDSDGSLRGRRGRNDHHDGSLHIGVGAAASANAQNRSLKTPLLADATTDMPLLQDAETGRIVLWSIPTGRIRQCYIGHLHRRAVLQSAAFLSRHRLRLDLQAQARAGGLEVGGSSRPANPDSDSECDSTRESGLGRLAPALAGQTDPGTHWQTRVPAGLVACGSEDGSICMWDMQTGRLQGRLLPPGQPSGIGAVATCEAPIMSRSGTAVGPLASESGGAGPGVAGHAPLGLGLELEWSLLSGGDDGRVCKWT